jgi:hypothetical protein
MAYDMIESGRCRLGSLRENASARRISLLANLLEDSSVAGDALLAVCDVLSACGIRFFSSAVCGWTTVVSTLSSDAHFFAIFLSCRRFAKLSDASLRQSRILGWPQRATPTAAVLLFSLSSDNTLCESTFRTK